MAPGHSPFDVPPSRIPSVSSVGGLRRSDLTALHQIASRAEAEAELTFVTTASATDPMLEIAVRRPIDFSRSNWHRVAWVAVILLACLLITALAGGVYFVVRPAATRMGQVLDRLALSVSDPGFLVVDRFAMGCYLGILTFFVLSVAAGLHGSSISMYSTATVVARAPVQPIAGTGKAIRGDEWAYHTPAILHQVYRATPFDSETTPLGPDHASLFANLPVRHFTTIFRPQFWGFFVFAPEYAFSFYWQFKALLLLTGVFSLLLLLTQSSRVAAFGALWYAFSPNIQWTYSWPSLLPDMVGLFCLVICAVFYMSVGRRPARLVAAATICALCAVNFALCAYVPHQIPLVWLGVFLCIWWVVARRKAIFTRDYALPRIAALGSAWCVVGLVMVGFYLDAEPALTTMANTDLPRAQVDTRRWLFDAGDVLAFLLVLGERPTPAAAPGIRQHLRVRRVLLAGAHHAHHHARRDGNSREEQAYWTLMTFGALLLVWMTLPVPNAIGQALFMDKTGAGRCVHVLGLVNIALVALALSFGRARAGTDWRRSFILGAAVLAVVAPVLWLTNSRLAGFLTTSELVTAASYATIVIVSVIENRFRLLAALLVLPHIAVFGLVNPVDRGLRVVESAPLVPVRPSQARAAASSLDRLFGVAPGCDVLFSRWLRRGQRPRNTCPT